MGGLKLHKININDKTKQKTKKDWQNDHYLVEGVFEKQTKKLYDRKLGARLDPSQVNTDKQAQKICKLFQVTVELKKNKKTLKRNLTHAS